MVGRYVKSLTNWNSYQIKKGDYLKIIEVKSHCFVYEKFGASDNPINTSNWELMPENWTPEHSSNSFDLSKIIIW